MTRLEQVTAIHNFLRRIFVAGDLIEIRGLGSKDNGTMSFLTDDLYLGAKAAAAMEGRGADVYFTLNPISRESRFAERCVQRSKPYCHVKYTAGNADIAKQSPFALQAQSPAR
jgi:hypothetical protein